MKAILFLLLLASVPRAFSDEQLYRSNDFGMTLQPVSPYLRDSSRWILGVARTGQKEVRRLYDKGKEVRRWEMTGEKGSRQEEREYSNGVLTARRIYDAEGNLLQEDAYEAGALTQKSLYSYSGNRLSRKRNLAPDGGLIASEEYVYATNGTLRGVRSTRPKGEVQVSSYVAGPSGVSEERNTVGDVLSIQRYDTEGKLVSRERRRGDDVLDREDFVFRPDSALLLSSREKQPPEGRVIDRRYDESGRLVSETMTAKGAAVEDVSYMRDEKGRVIAKNRRSPTGLEQWKYTLDDSGKVTREAYFRLGGLVKVTVYGQGKQRSEEYYKDEELVLKAFFDGDTRLREEVYSDGMLVRERRYP
jgi:antitoxin component YwqK of YwqJK toxin-antitoxin module